MFAGAFWLVKEALTVIGVLPSFFTTIQVGVQPPLCPLRGSTTTVLTKSPLPLDGKVVPFGKNVEKSTVWVAGVWVGVAVGAERLRG